MEIGSAYPLEERMTMEIKGRHLIEGVPKTITISDEEIREALAETVNVIVDAVRVALERTPPELSADIVDRGIVLTGGGALLKNLDKRLREETGPAAGDGGGPAVLGRARAPAACWTTSTCCARLPSTDRRHVKAPLTPAAVLGVRRRTGPLLVTALLAPPAADLDAGERAQGRHGVRAHSCSASWATCSA